MNESDEQEIARRRDEALARLLKMPPKPHEDMKLGKPRRKVAGSKTKRTTQAATVPTAKTQKDVLS